MHSLTHTQGRPESLIVETLIIPPVCIRPSAPSKNDGKEESNEDDLTTMLRGMSAASRVSMAWPSR
jgi:DNA-directed RNA polymerase beta' subunit